MNYLKQYSTKRTPQGEKIPGRDQVKNSAGGFVFAAGDWERLDRFLVLGSEGGSYYVGERELTAENAEVVVRCASADGPETVRRIVAVSKDGRAAKNDPALFALALAAAVGDQKTKEAAYLALPSVARTGTHLFTFIAFSENMRGWGPGFARAVARWYTDREPDGLAYQLVKYRQRGDWTHRDVLRSAHPSSDDPAIAGLLEWVARPEGGSRKPVSEELPRIIKGFEKARKAKTPEKTARLVRKYGLPREALNTDHLSSPEVWLAMLEAGMPMTAMIRNLGNMTRSGLVAPLSEAAGIVVEQLRDEERLRAARVHPIAVLSALKTYASGQGVRGSGVWDPVGAVVDALDSAFYSSFGAVEATGRRLMLALDCSASMTWPTAILAGVPGLYARTGSAAMALVTAAVEPRYMVTGFTASFPGGRGGGRRDEISPLAISPRQRLDDVVQAIESVTPGATDCALPMLYASANSLEVDAFVIYTDSETWYGAVHPTQALADYRRRSGIDAKLVVVAMTSNGFSIADPDDPGGQLDVVGFDTVTPNVISEFVCPVR